MVRQTYKYRIYPTPRQVGLLENALGYCCELYNAALQERRDAWKLNRVQLGYCSQSAQIPAIRSLRPDLSIFNAEMLRETLQRVDKAFKGFFRRVKAGQKAGYPRFRSFRRYDSLTFPRACKYLAANRVRVPGIGHIKIKLHRPLEGTTKQLTIKREAGKWYACFSVECESNPLPIKTAEVGLDMGLTAFATLSDGREIPRSRFTDAGARSVRIAARKVARRKKGGHGRRKAVQLLQRAHIKVRNQRADFHHKESRKLVNEFGFIAVEDLNVKRLAGGMLSKSVHDAGWGQFLRFLAYKAESAGREFVAVNPSGTSQECLCGARVEKKLSDRWHECTECGLSEQRDHVSAQIILGRGLRLQESTWPVAASVS